MTTPLSPRTAFPGALLLVLALGLPSTTFADLIPQRVASCRNADEGDRCKPSRGSSIGGTCVLSKCRGKDYSNGAPPDYYYYGCLKCLTRTEREELEERIESGEVEDPEELPSRDNAPSRDDVEIIRGDTIPPEDPPDIADDEDDEGEQPQPDDPSPANDGEADVGTSSDAGTRSPDAGSDDGVSDPDASDEPEATEGTTEAPRTTRAAAEPDADTAQEPADDDGDAHEDGASTNLLVTAGSIGLGLVLVFLGFRRRS